MKNYIRTGLIAGLIASGVAVGIAQIGSVNAQTDDVPGDDTTTDQPTDGDNRPDRSHRAAHHEELALLLGVDVETLHEALHSGQTLASIAIEQGVNVDTVIAAIVESRATHIDGAVADGKITQEKADDLLAALEERVSFSVNEGRSTHDARGIGRRGGEGERLEELASLLGVEAQALGESLRSGSTLADVAVEQGVDVDTVINTIVSSKTERIDAAVEEGRITREQADEHLAELEERVTTSVNEGRPDRGKGGPRGDRSARSGRAPADAGASANDGS